MKSKNPIVQKFLDGKMDAGGTIAALEKRIEELERQIRQILISTPRSTQALPCHHHIPDIASEHTHHP